MQSRLRRTLRERVTNYGDAQTVTDEGQPTIFTFHGNDGEQRVLIVQCEEIFIPPAAVGLADFRPMVHVEWGHGASSVNGDFDCTFRQRIPVAGSTVEVSGFIGVFKLPAGAGPLTVPTGARVKLRAFMSEGIDGLPLFATQWVTQFNSDRGVLAVGQARLASLRAFAADKATAKVPYLLLFDKATAPVAGDVPIDAMRLPIGGPVGAATGVSTPSGDLPMGQTAGYVHGVAWAISSTPYVQTDDTDALTAFVRAEFLS
jgi:hypothetical protein